METILTILDKFLLYLLSKTRKDAFEDGVEVLFFLLYFPGVVLFAFGLVCFVIFESFFVRNFNTGNNLKSFFLSAFVLGSIILLLSLFVKIRLKKVIEEYSETHISNVKEKKIYGVGLETELVIYPKYEMPYKEIKISTKEPFPYLKMKDFENQKITIEVLKGNESNFTSGGKTHILLKNEEEIAKLEVPEKALNYKIEEVWLIQEIVKRTCGSARDTSENVYTKILLSASVDKDRAKRFKDKEELDALLKF